MRRGQHRTNQHMLTAAEREAQALHMRKVGKSFQEIADALGYANRDGAYRAVMRAIQKTLQEPADELRKLEVERLDMMLAALIPKIEAKNDGTPRAVEVAIKVLERRAKFLGLDAPEKREDTHTIKIEQLAGVLAEESGFSPDEVIAEAQRLVVLAQRGEME